MDGSRIHKEKVAFSNQNGFVWTGALNPSTNSLRIYIFFHTNRPRMNERIQWFRVDVQKAAGEIRVK